MKKTLLLACALLGLCNQSAFAAPVGWYDLTQTWRNGSYQGRFYYDGSAAVPVTQIAGILTDIAQTTTIGTVWNGEVPAGESWVYVNNALPGDPDTYDAGFYLHLVDLGHTLTLDTSADNGLYDWSGDFAYFTTEQQNGSPLVSFAITPETAVQEPATLALLSAGLLLCVSRRRRLPGRV